MTFFQAIQNVLSKYAVFSGRARRKEYWYFFLFNSIVGFILGFLGGLMQKPHAMRIAVGVYTLAVLLPNIAVSVRRLHDTGRSGWWYLVMPVAGGLAGAASAIVSEDHLLVPMLMLLVSLALEILFLVWACTDSQPGSNRFGPNPKGTADPAVAARVIQAAVAHSPQYLFLDPAMTTLDPQVLYAMGRVFPGYDGVSRLESVLASQPVPEVTAADTDSLLVLYKYSTAVSNADPNALSALQYAIIEALSQRGAV